MSGSVLLQQAASAGLGDYAGDLLRSLFALLGVGALGYVALRALGSRGLGRSVGPVQVVQRLVLEPRRTLYVVRVGGRTLLLGCGDSGAPSLIAELSGDDLRALEGKP